MHNVHDIKTFLDIPILVRTSMNVPVENGKVVSDYRLRRSLPTIRFLSERGARVVLISHIGERGTETLAPVARTLGGLVSCVSFFGETVGSRARGAVRNLNPGNILVMENLRRNRGELENSRAFAEELAELGDFFIQDCFDTCHRSHASIVGVPKILPSYAGILIKEEIEELSRALSPKRPSLAVVGGAKFKTKKTVLEALLKTHDHVFVGGAIANDFFRAGGQEIGRSLISNSTEDDISIKKILNNPKLILPIDSVVVNETILDHGPKTSELLSDLVQKAKSILWNGPLGNCENGFVDATNAFTRAVANSSAYSVVGGGDTIAAIENLGLLSRFSFVSTGGGAMLDFIAKGTLPGIESLN